MKTSDKKAYCRWFLNHLSGLLVPSICVFCENITTVVHFPFEGICRPCLAKIPFRSGSAVRTPCLEHRNPEKPAQLEKWNMDALKADAPNRYVCDQNMDVLIACNYETMIRKALISMKFYEAAYMKYALGSIACHAILSQNEAFDGIIPIPLHPSRRLERGYNQAELIAAQVAKSMKIPLLKGCLVRRKNTKRQSEMSHYEERLQNVSDAFFCVDPERLAGKNLLLLDDILTSGETLMSAANAIRTAVAKLWKEAGDVKKNPIGDVRLTGIVLASGRRQGV